MKELKDKLRRKYLEIRNSLTSDEIAKRSADICANLFSTELYCNADSIFTYINIGSEVQTVPIIKRALQNGKKVYVPKIYPINIAMKFFEFKTFDDLRCSKFGLLTPSNCTNEIFPNINSIILTPGLVFGYDSFRIGYGKGYYDYYFAKNICYNKIGLSFDAQLVDSIPHDDYDVSLDLTITETISIKKPQGFDPYE